ncbi:MAG TPA: isochorismatase family protein [Rhodanobacteraceae bacterium]|nr:isochorismatase family protein [Rhodanobacteraceae bacterium]
MFQHPARGFTLDPADTALVLTDIHNDFLSPTGGAYPLIAESLAANDTAANLERLMAAAQRYGFPVFVSPHYYYPHDDAWTRPVTPLEDLAHQIGLLGRKGPLSLESFENSGADFPERYKRYVEDGATVVTSPHKAYGTSTNDLLLQLRRRRVEKIVLAGPVGNLCVEAHLRDFIEQGFEIAMVRDATAGAKNDEGDGYGAALVNWRFMAHALWTTAEVVARMKATGVPTSIETVHALVR